MIYRVWGGWPGLSAWRCMFIGHRLDWDGDIRIGTCERHGCHYWTGLEPFSAARRLRRSLSRARQWLPSSGRTFRYPPLR